MFSRKEARGEGAGICRRGAGPWEVREALRRLEEQCWDGRNAPVMLLPQEPSSGRDLMAPSPGTQGLRGQIELSGTLESETEKPQG